jgi:hypothetical protein
MINACSLNSASAAGSFGQLFPADFRQNAQSQAI